MDAAVFVPSRGHGFNARQSGPQGRLGQCLETNGSIDAPCRGVQVGRIATSPTWDAPVEELPDRSAWGNTVPQAFWQRMRELRGDHDNGERAGTERSHLR
jgi:hypothetical protein